MSYHHQNLWNSNRPDYSRPTRPTRPVRASPPPRPVYVRPPRPTWCARAIAYARANPQVLRYRPQILAYIKQQCGY